MSKQNFQIQTSLSPFWLPRKLLYFLAPVLLLTVIVYANSFQNQFVEWDDWAYITENELIRDLSPQGIKSMFSTFYAGNYHPLTALSNAIDYYFFELTPQGYHFVNLLFHLLNTVLVFLFIFKITSRVETATICALFFAIHPMHVESVTWLSERKDVLYSFFFLLSALHYTHYLQSNLKRKYLYFSILFFSLSLLSKPAAVVLPLVLLLIDYYLKRPLKNAQLIIEKLPFFALSVLFGVITIFAQKNTDAFNQVASDFNPIQRLFLTSYSYAYYHLKAIFPTNLAALHPFPNQLGTLHYASILFVVIPIILLRKASVLRKELWFGFGFFLANIMLVLHIPVGQAIVAERYTYLPYIGLFFVLGQTLCYFTDKEVGTKNYWYLAIFLFTIFFSFATWNRNKVWKDSISLFDDMIKKNPTSGYAYVCRGDVLKKFGNYQEAEQDYNFCLQYSPQLTFVYYNRGVVRHYQNNNAMALQDLDKAAQAYPDREIVFHERSNVKYALKDYNGSIADANRVLAMNPNYALAYHTRGSSYFAMGNLNQAISDYTNAIGLKSDFFQAYIWRGRAKQQQNKLNEACADWKISQQIINSQEAKDLISKFCR